jgi:hypothetical protein
MMERVNLVTGLKIGLPEIFDDVQDYMWDNLVNSISPFINSYGVIVLQEDNVITSNDLKITSYGDGSTVQVASGYGMLNDGQVIHVPTNTIVNVPQTLTNGEGVYVYITPSVYTVDPKDVAYGQVLGLPGLPTGTVNIAQYDTWTLSFTPTVMTLASGVLLASGYILYVEGLGKSVLAGIQDHRSSNIFEFSDKVYSQNIQRVDADITDAVTKKHTQNTDTGTTSLTFKVGVGLIGPSGSGIELAREAVAPAAPQNFKVTDIYPYNDTSLIQTLLLPQLAVDVSTGLISNKANVAFSWNYAGLQGTGGSGCFTVTGSILSVSSNELINRYFWLGYNTIGGYRVLTNNNYLITSNSATTGGSTVIYITDLDGNIVNLVGRTVEGDDTCLIHAGADGYDLIVLPCDNSGNVVPEQKQVYMINDADPTSNISDNADCSNFIIPLSIGEMYKCYIRARRQSLCSSNTILASGNFTKGIKYYPTTVPYAANNKLSCLLPTVSSDGATITTMATSFGFRVTISPGSQSTSGWTLATDYEIAWTTNGTANFTDLTQERMRTNSTVVYISTAESDSTSVAVRPLMSGQAVASPLYSTVVPGAGGTPPNDSVLSEITFSKNTYSGIVTSGDNYAGGYVFTCASGILTPATTGSAVDTVPVGEAYAGSILKLIDAYPSIDFIIQSISFASPNTLIYVKPSGGTINPLGLDNEVFEINTSENGRLLRLLPYPTNCQITRVTCDATLLLGDNVVVSWYQQGIIGKALKNTMLMTGPIVRNIDSTIFEQPSNVFVLSYQGSLVLVTSLYDSAVTAYNKSCVAGIITIYGKNVISSH